MLEKMRWEAATSRIPVVAPQQRASELLERYPDLSEHELDLLIDVYRNLSALDVALLLSDDDHGPKLTRFRAENRKRVKTPFGQYAILVAIAYAGLAVVIWAMMVAW